MPIRTASKYLLFTVVFGCSLTVFAQDRQPIGVVLTAKGKVEARDEDGVVRPLTRRAEIFEGDTILVDAQGFTQLRMADNGKISLTPNTSLSLNSFKFDGDPQTPDSFTMSLLSGGLRTITGSIGDSTADEYRLDTPVASINSVGTTYGVQLVNGTLYATVSTGGIIVSNGAGNLAMGIGSDWDYSVTKPGEAPLGLIDAPTALVTLDPF
ncbi:MAG: FecR domain-containing protein [Pseudomonadota bacterium]